MNKLSLLAIILVFGICFADIDSRPDIRPLKDSDLIRICGTFGEKRSMEGIVHFHTGCDYACNLDTEAKATGAGTVIWARFTGGYGNLVIIKHDWVHNGRNYSAYSLYGHLVEFNVRKGDQVTKGQVVGYAGMTGRAQGVHIHYELRDANNSPIFNGTYQVERKQEEHGQETNSISQRVGQTNKGGNLLAWLCRGETRHGKA